MTAHLRAQWREAAGTSTPFHTILPQDFHKLEIGDEDTHATTLAGVREHLKSRYPKYYQELHRDIARNGVQTPVLLSGNRIMDGHHRLSIADELHIPVPAGDYDNPDHYDRAAWYDKRTYKWQHRREELGERRTLSGGMKG